MKVLLDTCVLYPSVMREVLLAVAAKGLFTPLWSPRILEEWARAARKLGPLGEMQARGEIAVTRSAFPDAVITPKEGLANRLYLPDPDDIHVLAAAITGNADVLVTMNAKDFPLATLREEGVERQDPDTFLWQIWSEHPDQVVEALKEVQIKAARMDNVPRDLRALLKKARLNRLAKAVSA
ncbi:MAG: PIN domain-containing protein [Paracoccaceae bacterium]|nr:PIN domain-containing protein [Paracoccaceae bacterium]